MVPRCQAKDNGVNIYLYILHEAWNVILGHEFKGILTDYIILFL